MGGSFSTTDYRDQIVKFQKNYLSQEDATDLQNFLLMSEDFYNMFTTCQLEDFRKVKEAKSDNIIYLMSFVSRSMNCRKKEIQNKLKELRKI
jgi:hypothetical protein